MFSELMAKAKNHFDSRLPFVLYRKPKERFVNGLFQNDEALHYVVDFTEKGFVFAPFDSLNPGILILKDELVSVDDFTPIKGLNNDNVAASKDIGLKKFHIELVKKGITQIHKNVFEKVVLSRQLTVESVKNPFDLFNAVLSRYTNSFCYLWFHPKVGLWLGATPEILLQTENKRITTMSLAGTRVYGNEQGRQWGSKELFEQSLVTQYIQRALGGNVSNLIISEVETVSVGNLQHLRTKITGELKTDLKEIVKALHPTPAVCGMPLDPARNFILENERYNREFYTGFLGELNLRSTSRRATSKKNQENQVYKSVKSRTKLWVNLRCMKMVGNKAIVYVGGGITKDSDPEKEWQETEEKSKTMLNLLELS